MRSWSIDLRSRPSRRASAILGSALMFVSLMCAASVLGCSGPGPREPLTLLASFPEDAIAVCFVREDDGSEIGCTTRALVANPDGTLDYRGETLKLRAQSPTGKIAVVSGIEPPDASADRPLRVRAVAYNEAGASDPSSQYFALDRKSQGFPKSRENGALAAKDAKSRSH